MKPIGDVALAAGLDPHALLPAGPGVLRLPVPLVRSLAARGRRGRIVLVSAMTPTEHGEGKTVVAIGLAMALARIGQRSVVCLRQPSLGPVFGVKGGASGGGRSTVEPRSLVDFGLTGDLDAITNAQNLLASLVDHHIYRGNASGIAPDSADLPRALALEDRSLRNVTVGVGFSVPGFPRPSGFVVSAATEFAAIHALARDFVDLKERIGRVVVGHTATGGIVRASDLGFEGSSAALLGGALAPNLVQTTEGTPALVHGIPYANVAHGTCSRLAIEAGAATSDFCVVEGGFATELGAEKFVDIVAPVTELPADVGVIVATIRALKFHGGADPVGPPAPEAVRRGFANLQQHIDNLRAMGLDPIVALNRFPKDDPAEVRVAEQLCAEAGTRIASVSAFGDGGAGAEELARQVVEAARQGRTSHPLYGPGTPVEEILHRVVTRLYGGAGVELTPEAAHDLERLRTRGEAVGPVCIAKTPRSLSDDVHRIGRPTGFTVRVRRLVRWAGAGFTVAYLGPIVAMPGLPEHPAAESIDLTAEGQVVGTV